MEAKILWFIQLCLMVLSFILQIIAMSASDAMWTSDGDGINGCGLFGCDGLIPCGCLATGCTDCTSSITNDGCSDVFVDIACEDLAGHMSAAQAFSILIILVMIPALLLCIVRVSPLADKIPDWLNVQMFHVCAAILCLITFALVAASYDRDLCGCAVKDQYDSGLSYGFAFLVINFVFQVICAILAGASQAMEASGGGDYASYSS